MYETHATDLRDPYMRDFCATIDEIAKLMGEFSGTDNQLRILVGLHKKRLDLAKQIDQRIISYHDLTGA